MRSFTLLLGAILLSGSQADLFNELNGVRCTQNGSAAPIQPQLNDVRTASVRISGAPVSVQYVRNGAFALYSSDLPPCLIGVLDTTSFMPKLIATVPLNESSNTFSVDKQERYLYSTSDYGSYVVDIAEAIAGNPNAVVAYINGTTTFFMPGSMTAFATQIFDDNSILAVAFENGPATEVQLGSKTTGDVQFIGLTDSSGTSPVSAKVRSQISLGYTISGLSLSPDGKLLYATSQQVDPAATLPGYHTIFNVTELESRPANAAAAIISNVFGGCQPVRTLPSSDGKIVWATARASNLVVAYDAARMIADPGNAIIATVDTGTNPVGLILVRNETRLLVADSNRFKLGPSSGITVIDTEAAMSGCDDANLGQIPTGYFPREFTLSPDGNTVLVTDNYSGQIQAIDVSTLP